MSQVFRKGPTSPEMNMTPMIDVVFLLIIFFMLVNQIIAEETVKMIVPELDEPKTRETGDIQRITINLAPEDFDSERKIGDLTIPGEASYVKVGLDEYDLTDMEGVTAALKNAKEHSKEVEILLRADAGLYYEAVQPVMQAIASAEIVKVNLVAYLPKDKQ